MTPDRIEPRPAFRQSISHHRVLVVVQPFESHVRALWSTVNALSALGHDALVAAPPKLAHTIRNKYRFRHSPAGIDWADERAAARLAGALDKGNNSFCDLLITDYLAGPHLMRSVDELTLLAQSWRPDTIVTDITDFAGSLVAEKRGVRNLVFNNGWAGIFETKSELLRDRIAPYRAALGLSENREETAPPPIFDPTPAGLLLGDIPGQEIVRYQPENPRRVGASLPPWVGDLPSDGYIYLSLGSILTRSPQFKPLLERHYARYIEALAAIDDCPSVVALGPALRRSFAPHPNIRFETWVPQELLLQAGASLFITHGGASSIREGLIAKARMLFAPISSDQYANADSCAALGLGEVIPPDAPIPAITQMIRDNLDAPKSDPAVLDWQRRSLMLPPIGKALPPYLDHRKVA